MRKIAALVLLVCAIAFAAAPSWTAVDGSYIVNLDTTFQGAISWDSLTTGGVASDSMAICTKWSPKYDMYGGQYILQFGPMTGGTVTGDSAKVQIKAKVYDYHDSLVNVVALDSIITAGADFGENILLDIGGALVGHKYTITMHSYNLNADPIVIKPGVVHAYKRKPVSLMLRP